MNTLLSIFVINTKTDRLYTLTGFQSRSDGVVTVIGLKDVLTNQKFQKTLDDDDFNDFVLVS